ncbi:hypothetical protein [Burkholderia anthina]|uniref:hypothetical protein n=1 Tax=Burkholderia anthina TaxID=179879 RepID=UPI0015898AD7
MSQIDAFAQTRQFFQNHSEFTRFVPFITFRVTHYISDDTNVARMIAGKRVNLKHYLNFEAWAVGLPGFTPTIQLFFDGGGWQESRFCDRMRNVAHYFSELAMQVRPSDAWDTDLLHFSAIGLF